MYTTDKTGDVKELDELLSDSTSDLISSSNFINFASSVSSRLVALLQ